MTRTAKGWTCRRWVAAILAVLIGLGPLATPSYAALTALADQPLSVQNQAKPNIVLTVDDSTSMLFDFLPDTVVQRKYCRDITGNANAICGDYGQNTNLTAQNRGKYVTPGYIFQQYGIPYGAYDPSFDTSGPGAGCDLTSIPNATCSGGIDPGPLPGLERYPNPPGPPPAKSPKAGQEYEYWTLWPAPVHNSEVNHVYYNPRLNYDPPVYADGSSYPQMTAANTTNWTRVPADPWASTIQYVDLTRNVTIGLWCDSDWSIGHETDPAYCRTNGTGPSAATASASTPDGDYNYPWAPPGISPGNGPTTAKSIAWSKVDSATHALKPAWATAQDPKYFYENDNILWCDSTNPLWPNQGPLTTQTCVGGSVTPQVCNGLVHQTCSAGTPQTCAGVTPQTCGGQQSQTCGNYNAQTCNGTVTQVCNGSTPQTCAGVGPQTCAGITGQTCDNITPQTCGNYTGQACNGVTSQVCNLVAPVCVPPDPATCTTAWNDPRCPCAGPECVECHLVTTCPPGTCSSNGASCNTAADCPSSGTCSSTAAVCTSNAQCPTIAGHCSVTPANTCFAPADCPTTGTCSVNTVATCQTNADCPTFPGHCTIDNNPCFSNATCPNEGHCSLAGNICTTDAQCPTQPGQCTVSHAACIDNSACPNTGGTCSVSGAACISNAQCPTILGACSVNGQACTTTADCPPAGQCSIVHNTCTSDAQCPIVPGQCTSSHAACTVDANCPTIAGQCTISHAGCFDNSGCPPAGQTCSVTGEACSQTPYYPICQWDFVTTCTEPQFCPITGGTCSIDGSACTHFFFNFWPFFAYDLAYCFPVTTVGQCSITHASCTYDFQCPPTSGPSANAVCSDMLSDNSKSLLEDANSAGVVCRHNNKTYGATLANRYNYPDVKYNTPVTAGTGANACVASNRYALVPRHYWKTSVEWCDKQIATPADKWLGYGTPTGGTCQDSPDTSHVFPRFFKFGQDPGTDNYAIPAFQRIDLDIAQRFTATYVHNWEDDGGTPQSITRTFDGATPDVSEMTNYANWFAYYRTRIQAVKTVTSLAFKEIDTKYRVGFHTLFKLSSFVNIADFGAAQKAAWYTQLFGITIPLGQETPSLSAMVRIGDYYKNGTHPQLVGSTDPIVLACQKNWHMFFTDGYTNENGLPTTLVGNQDDTVPAGGYPDMATKPISGLNAGAAFPKLFREDAVSGSASNSLSDYAMYYWITDLRPAMPNNVPTPPPPLDVYMRDPASWQHQNFAALSLGTAGKLPAGNPTTTEAQLKAGSLQWPKPFPSVNKPDNSGVDDLWHAAINGRGRFVNAESAQDVKQGIGQILADITNQSGTRAGVGFISNTFGASANFRYQVGFEPGWTGTVTKVQIVPTTGQPIAVNPTQWDAAAQLAVQLTIVPGIKDTPWFSERKIVTMNQAGAKVPFLWANLGANQKDSLAPGRPARGQAVLEYLRGSPLKEGPKVGQFRQRDKPLGDVVDSSAVYVGPPNAPYLDGNDPGYSGFATTFSARAKRVYVGANDGMLHALDDATGNETWAYVPTPLFRGGTAGGDFRAGLGALALQDGALPAFRHHFYVDVTPKVVDADFGSGDWHSVLVGGLGKGGNRYYALDVTQPAAITSEAAAATKILWEFPPVGDTATDMGYSYGKPMIAKTHEFGWTAIVASGYNNPSGVGRLYFLRISDATVLNSMSTGVGTAGTPSGLAHPAGYTQDFRNQLVEQIYSGDLVGDFWRFDVSAASAASWTSGQFASLVDGVGAAQPVTTPPEIKVDIVNGIDRWVFVGTGKLLDDSDLQIPNPPQQQTMYAIRDGTASAPWALPVTPISRSTAGMLPVSHSAALDFGLASKPDKGWFDDLPIGQRIVVPPQAAVGVVAYIGTRPQTDPCLTGLPVNIYARDYTTGKSLLTENDDGTGALVETLADEAGGVALSIVSFETAPGATVPDVRIAITRADGSVRYIKPKLPSILFQHRMSWRLIGQ